MPMPRCTPVELSERILLAVLFVALGGLIYTVFNPLRPLLNGGTLEKSADYLGRISLCAGLVTATGLVRKSRLLEKYSSILLGMAIMAMAVSLDRIFGIYLLVYLNVSDTVPAGWAIQKLNECFVVVGVVVTLTRFSGCSLGSIYIQKGKLKLGLTIGLMSFLLAAAGSVPMAALFKAQDLSLPKVMAWLPWLLVFVFANAAQEELLFRGLFLRKLEPFFGRRVSNLLIAFVFTLLHRGVSYTADNGLFLAALVPLALAWGYLMQKTDSLWASLLFHAGMDIPVMLGIFSSLP